MRRWSEEEDDSDRVTWIECFGIPPKCWSFENVTLIGEIWGKVLHIDHDKEGVNSLTYARLMVRTRMKKTIDARIKMEWERGRSEVWVREARLCECMSRIILKQCEEESNYKGVDESSEQQQPCSPRMDNCEEGMGNSNEVGPCNAQLQRECEDGENVSDQILNFQAPRDEVMVMVNSSPIVNHDAEWYDPILSIECSLNTNRRMNLLADTTMSTTKKRMRGRPKRNANSLPIPLYVPPSPSVSNDEALETWKVAKTLGVSATNEEAVIRELRKSKRLQTLEENPIVG